MILLNIIAGWARRFGLLKVPKDLQALSKKRLDICDTCVHARESRVLEVINGTVESVHKKYCGQCGCPCLEKSLVYVESCPIHKW